MNQRWAEVLCVLAAGPIARLRGDRISICSNVQWIEFDGSKGWMDDNKNMAHFIHDSSIMDIQELSFCKTGPFRVYN